jgi:hypothetical protein
VPTPASLSITRAGCCCSTCLTRSFPRARAERDDGSEAGRPRHKPHRRDELHFGRRAAGLGAPNYLKLVIDGKRNLSSDMAERFARACRLNADGTEYFRTLVAFNQASTDEEKNALHARLSKLARFRSAQRLDLVEKATPFRCRVSRIPRSPARR